MNIIIRFLWPLVFKYKKWIYPFKLIIYQYRLYKTYNYSESIVLYSRLILMFDNNFSQGGLVDRLKGVVSAFYFSQKLNLQLFIFFSNPEDPFISILNQSNLKILTCVKQVSFSKKTSYPIVWINYFPRYGFKYLSRLSKSKQIHLYTNMNVLPNLFKTNLEANKAWSLIFNQIFIYNTPFVFQSLRPAIIKNIIGVHLRFIGLLGDFKDLRDHSVSSEYIKYMLDWCINNIISISDSNPYSYFLIVSDSKLFLEYLENYFNSTLLKNKIIIDKKNIAHTALSLDQMIFNKAYSDFISLSMCHKIFQLRYGKMHKSDFSKYASILSMNDFIIIEKHI
jgi:hypothetical protein